MQLTEQLETKLNQLRLFKKQSANVSFCLFLGLVVLFILNKMALPLLLPYPNQQLVIGFVLTGLLFWHLIKLNSFVVRLELIEGAITGYQNLKTTTHLASFNEYEADLIAQAKQDDWIAQFLAEKRPELNAHLQHLSRVNRIALLEKSAVKNVAQINIKITQLTEQLPLIQVKKTLAVTLNNLVERKKALQAQWAAAYADFSWWNKLKYPQQLPLQELDKTINHLHYLQSQLLTLHSKDFIEIEQGILLAKKNAECRIKHTAHQVKHYLMTADATESTSQDQLQRAFWFSAFSLPISIWNDVSQASDVYSALRSVNSQYEGLTDSEIWWQTLFLPSEQLAGLAALTKGAYFEQLVANDFNGELHSHFNHADTDIMIDGIAYQIKATDSAVYIDSVKEGVPIIATSDIAAQMNLIDGGYTNAELNHTIDLAMGGTVVDVPDTTTDAILAGLGGLGFFATLNGINHAAGKIENGGDAAEALFEGAGVAIEQTAMALVGLAETTYKALNSRPSRFVGRLIKKGAIGLGNKLSKY